MEKTSELTSAEINKAANISRREHGEAFEKQNQELLLKRGIACSRDTITLPNGEKYISDHCYMNVWMESTTHFDKKRVDEFIKKREGILSVTKKYGKFILLYEKTADKRNVSGIAKLEHNGWVVIDGQNKIETFVKLFSKTNAFTTNNKITNVATPKMIRYDNLVKNPLNREQIEEGVVNIAHSIINDGFLTCLFVVPHTKNEKGEQTYMLFEGHHRLDAVQLVRKWGFILDELPCIVVDWISSDQMEKLSNLLIKINVEYRKWMLRDYIRHHAAVAEILGLDDKLYSYQTLLDLMRQSKSEGFGDNFFVYIFGKCYGASLWLDLPNIKGGEFRMTKEEYDNFVVPFIEELKDYYFDAKEDEDYNNGVYQYLCKRLFIDLKEGRIDINVVRRYLAAYNNLSKTPTTTEKLKEIWDTELQKQYDKLLKLA